jgi:hypothetical protein
LLIVNFNNFLSIIDQKFLIIFKSALLAGQEINLIRLFFIYSLVIGETWGRAIISPLALSIVGGV